MAYSYISIITVPGKEKGKEEVKELSCLTIRTDEMI